MNIAVLKETAAYETRVSITPDVAKKLIALGYSVLVEKNAGVQAGFSDNEYEDAGCKIALLKTVLKDAQIVCCVAQPSVATIKNLPEGAKLIGMLKPFNMDGHLDALNANQIESYAMELLPRITRGQAMDVLSSQSNLGGYRAVIEASNEFGRAFPLMMTAAGTVPAARVLVLGAGVAGLQAIATAKRLGAIVSAYDVRAASAEQVESLGAKFVRVDFEEKGDGEGGYAKEMSDAYKKAEQETLLKAISKSDIVITTAQIPGRPAPRLVSEEMLKAMRPGSVVVDMAVETGGNCALSELGNVSVHHGVKIVGYANMPGRIAYDASQLYSKNLFNFMKTLFVIEAGKITIDFADELIVGTNVTRAGQTVHARLAVQQTVETPEQEDKPQETETASDSAVVQK